ncbi:ribosomal RNA-processing protein 7 homolog A isoform X1 [Hydra vulgaris]|nr:ribosomal RNA-processing protein 7 homolog A [Hydra vulgaris]
MAAGFHTLKVSFDESSTNGHTLFIKRQNVKNDPKNDYTLFVVNLPPYCGKIGLENIFSECGEIKSILIKDQPGPDEAEKTDIIKWLNKEKYIFKVAYILFKETESVETALEMSSAVVRYMSTESRPILSGIKKWIHEYKNRYPNESTMQLIIDTYMKDFDQNNIKKKDNNEPNDEGWTTIPVKKSASTEKPKITRKMKKKEKKERIEKELMNFYVFQQREIKRDQIAELRRKFEEDKKRIAMLRQQRKFKPF